MADSSVLRRSFSNPSEASFHGQGDPLGESVSFGKYMSESLDWQKWSAFSHNRYIEEAEKYSKPGSVAKMKAYFEAHYKKKSSAKKQASIDDDSQSNLESHTNCHSHSSVNNQLREQDRKLPPILEPVVEDHVPSLNLRALEAISHSSVPVKEAACDVDLLRAPEANSHSIVHEFLVKEGFDVDLPCSVDSRSSSAETKEMQNQENINVNESTYEIESDIVASTSTERNVLIKENLALKSKHKSAISCMKRSTKSNDSKLSSSSLARLATPKKEICGTPKSRKAPLEDKKKLSLKLHNYVDAIETKKDSHKTRMGRIFSPMGKIIRDSFASTPAPPTRISTLQSSVSRASRHTYATPQTESKRNNRVAIEKSFDTSRKLEHFPSVCNTKQSPAPTIFSSFNFRTEERAAKRRELFQKKMEKEAEKMQLLNKAKQQTEMRKLSANLRANAHVLCDTINKIPPRRPESPMRKNFLPSQNQRRNCSMAKVIPTLLMTKKKKHENASPNIL